MSEITDASLGRGEALERLGSQFAIVANQCALLKRAGTDRDRRSVLLALITSAWELRDRATLAYEALVRDGEQGGIARGVLE